MPKQKKIIKLRKRVKELERERKEKRPKLNIHPETKRGVVTILLFTVAILFILSFQNVGGVLGSYLLTASKFIFGACLWIIPLALVAAGIAILKEIHKNIYLSTFLGILLFIICFLAIVQILFPDNGEYKAGWLGHIASWPFMELIGFWASLVVFVSLLLISVLISFNIPLKKTIKEKEDEKEAVAEKISKEINGLANPEEKMANFVKGIFKKPKFDMKEVEEEEKAPASLTGKSTDKEELLQTTTTSLKDYTFPPIDLLEPDKGYPSSGDIKVTMNIIQKTLETFNIPVEMGEVNVGPTVTQYTFRPASGVKLSKITSLHRDLSLSLAAHPIRIEAPIPGRSLVGIEIPNKIKTLVRMRNLLSTFDYKTNGHNLNLALGRDVAGVPVWANLVKMPHMLIAGATGTGKSVAIHSLILSLLYQKSPWELKFILIDPKRVELPLYNGIPHLLTPVIVEVNKTINAFKWAIKEMEERYKLLASVGVKDLASYNEKIVKTSPENLLPYIVIIVDELADIIAAYGKEIEGAIVRLAQMARAIGIHLVLSTQRPSVEVITGLIKANITSRIALQVASNVDSRTILDMSGAERLLGNGDMLFLAGDVGKPKRVQGGYVSDKEISNVVKFLRKQAGDVEYEEEITAPQPSQYGFDVNADDKLGLNVDDPLFHEAKDLIIKTGKASASYLQRRFRIGYARAASLLDMLEEAGIIGPVDGSKPRDILIGREKEDENLSPEILTEEESEETDEEDEIEESETEIEDIPKPQKFTKNQEGDEEIDF